MRARQADDIGIAELLHNRQDARALGGAPNKGARAAWRKHSLAQAETL